MVGVKLFGKSLPRLETSQSTPPFFQLYFLRRLKMSEICPLIVQNARNSILRKWYYSFKRSGNP